MAVSTTCTGISQSGGRVFLKFGKTTLEFDSVQSAREWVRGEDNVEAARRLLMAWWLQQNPSGSNPSLVVGKTLTVDLAAATNLVTVA